LNRGKKKKNAGQLFRELREKREWRYLALGSDNDEEKKNFGETQE